MATPNPKELMPALQALRGQRSAVVVEGRYREAAVLVALTEQRGELSVLLTQRARHLAIHPGESAFPGGKRDPEDKDLLATALREAQEEVALPPSSFELLFTLDQRLTRTDIKVSPFVGLIPSDLPLVPNPDEIERLFTVPLAFFAERKNLSVQEMSYQGKLKRTPSFRYGEHDVWGVTAMTLIDLVNTAFGADLSV